MPKVKTHSSCKKRFKITARGKIKRSAAYKRHHAWAKTPKSIRALRSATYIDDSQLKKIKSLMPH